jgi:hypothetical protein
MKGWTVMDPLREITVSTLVRAAGTTTSCSPEHPCRLAAGIRHAPLEIIERSGHKHYERTE